MKSTRSIALVMAMILLFVVVIGAFLGGKLPLEILTPVIGVVTIIVSSYFNKRDDGADRGDQTTSTTVTKQTETVEPLKPVK